MKAVLFDVIGTTVREADPDAITRCVTSAFLTHGIIVTPQQVGAYRGKEKREMMEALLEKNQRPKGEAALVYQSYQRNFIDAMHLFTAMDGAVDVFSQLRSRGIKLGLGTGLSRDLLDPLLAALQWPSAWFDFIGCPGPGVRGRPAPDMILKMMKALAIVNPIEVLKVGDTVADIEEGKNAGVLTAALISGTQPEAVMRATKPDFVFTSLGEVMRILR